MDIYVKITLISIFLFSSGIWTWFYRIRWFYPHCSFKHSESWRHKL